MDRSACNLPSSASNGSDRLIEIFLRETPMKRYKEEPEG